MVFGHVRLEIGRGACLDRRVMKLAICLSWGGGGGVGSRGSPTQ